ncbi:hypothetical protein ACFVR2_06830 [Gottfriedia sp. NPDC057991]|uniref:hypothetical protein n=1 Tax=Gottfriedia sp. NPDC057991 TaxID=3346298 RepID=UPI0036D97A6B
MLKKVSKFEKGFPDGVYVDPSAKKEPALNGRAKLKYCEEKDKEPEDLTEKEIEQFLIYE